MIVKEQKYILDKMSEIRAAIWKLQKRFEDRRLYRNTSNWERAIGGYLYPAVITDTIAAADGTVVLPGYGFWADRNTGMWRTPGNNIAFSINGFQYLEIENNNLDVDVPVHAIDGAAATPSYSFDADATMGFYRVGANSLGLSIGGVQRWGVSLVRTISTVPFRGPNGAVGAPSYSFIADTDCGMYYSATQLNFAVGGVQSFVITNVGGGTVTVDGLSLTGGAITDASGAISFGNENLATTSSITGGSLITGGNIGIAADTDLLQLAANALTVNGTITTTGNIVLPADGVVGVTDGNPQILFDNANNFLEITATRVGINITAPLGVIHTVSDNTTLSNYIDTYSNTTVPGFYYRRARGTVASPTAVQNGDFLGEFPALGYQNGDFRVGSDLVFKCDAAPAGNVVQGTVEFWTTNSGGTFAKRTWIASDGAVWMYVGANQNYNFRSHSGAPYLQIVSDGGAAFVAFRLDAGTLHLNTLSHGVINTGGDLRAGAGRDIDCYTNAGYLKPRRVSQSGIPTPDANELMVWRDSDDSKTYLVYNDADEGVRSVEMT